MGLLPGLSEPPVLRLHELGLRFVPSLPVSLSLSFITFLYLIVHIEQNESIPQDPSARAHRLTVQMAP